MRRAFSSLFLFAVVLMMAAFVGAEEGLPVAEGETLRVQVVSAECVDGIMAVEWTTTNLSDVEVYLHWNPWVRDAVFGAGGGLNNYQFLAPGETLAADFSYAVHSPEYNWGLPETRLPDVLETRLTLWAMELCGEPAFMINDVALMDAWRDSDVIDAYIADGKVVLEPDNRIALGSRDVRCIEGPNYVDMLIAGGAARVLEEISVGFSVEGQEKEWEPSDAEFHDDQFPERPRVIPLPPPSVDTGMLSARILRAEYDGQTVEIEWTVTSTADRTVYFHWILWTDPPAHEGGWSMREYQFFEPGDTLADTFWAGSFSETAPLDISGIEVRVLLWMMELLGETVPLEEHVPVIDGRYDFRSPAIDALIMEGKIVLGSDNRVMLGSRDTNWIAGWGYVDMLIASGSARVLEEAAIGVVVEKRPE